MSEEKKQSDHIDLTLRDLVKYICDRKEEIIQTQIVANLLCKQTGRPILFPELNAEFEAERDRVFSAEANKVFQANEILEITPAEIEPSVPEAPKQQPPKEEVVDIDPTTPSVPATSGVKRVICDERPGKVFTIREAADLAGCTKTSVYQAMKNGSMVYGKWHFRNKGDDKPAEIPRDAGFDEEARVAKTALPKSDLTLPENQLPKIKADKAVSKHGRQDAVVLICDELPGRHFTVRQAAELCGRSTGMIYDYVRRGVRIDGKYTFRKLNASAKRPHASNNGDEGEHSPEVIAKAEQINQKYTDSNGDDEEPRRPVVSAKDKHCPSCNYTGPSDHPQKCPRCNSYLLEPAGPPLLRYRQPVE